MAIEKERRDLIGQQVSFLSGVIKEVQAEYGKQILALSSGVLAISASFIKNVVDVNSAQWIGLIYLAWAALLVAIITQLINMKISVKANRLYKNELQDMLAKDAEVSAKETWRDKWIPRFTNIGTSLFALSMVSLITFSIINIHVGRVMSEQNLNEVRKPSNAGHSRVQDSVEVQRLPAAPETTTTTTTPVVPPPSSETKQSQ